MTVHQNGQARVYILASGCENVGEREHRAMGQWAGASERWGSALPMEKNSPSIEEIEQS